MPSPRYMRSPTRSRAKGDPEPPPLGTGDCNTKYALNVYSVHNLSTGRRRPVDKSSETFHSLAYLSTVSVDNSSSLWIKMWIRGVKPVDKVVDRIVDNSSLWITRHLSTNHPQEISGYPHFCPQVRGRLFSLGKAIFSSYTHIHRPYYYYCSNRYMV